jgi:hypothetical protein
MTPRAVGRARIGLGMLFAAILVAGTGGQASAKSGKRHLQARYVVAVRSNKDAAARLQLVSQQPVRLGVMRYYGGPKSPMWRAPVEN